MNECEYCGESKNLIDDFYEKDKVRVRILVDTLTVAIGNSYLKLFSADIEFCPKCGRDLTVERK